MMDGGRSIGTVKWFSGQKGFGFVAPDDGSEDLFVHQTEIQTEGFRTLREGQRVDFLVDSREDGRSKAVDVVILARSYNSGGRRGGGRGSGGGYGRGSGRGRGGGYGGWRGGDGVECYNCGRIGHLARECYRRGDGGGDDGYRGYGRGGLGGRGGGDDSFQGYGRGGLGGRGGGDDVYQGYGRGSGGGDDVYQGHGRGSGGGGGGGDGGYRGYGRGGGGRGRGGGGCYNCGEEGHFARDCPVAAEEIKVD